SETVTKRFDDVIGRDTYVRCFVFEQLRHGRQHAGDRAERRISFLEATNAVEVSKQFVGAVDQMNDHGEAMLTLATDYTDSHGKKFWPADPCESAAKFYRKHRARCGFEYKCGRQRSRVSRSTRRRVH